MNSCKIMIFTTQEKPQPPENQPQSRLPPFPREGWGGFKQLTCGFVMIFALLRRKNLAKT